MYNLNMNITDIVISQDLEILLKLATALFLGMSLGVERAIAGKTAGMRTYGLVTIGSALFVIIGVLASGGYENGSSFTDSAARVTAAIIQGIGFLGAGLIFFKDAKLSGVTTAAGIWVAAGIGIAIGYGFYILAIMATVFALFIFTVLWYIEHRLTTFAHVESEEHEER